MASEVKWIKIVTDIFDDEKILLIESMPEADSIIVIWFKLLCFAGKQNNCGVLTMNNRMPYTDEMLSTIFRRPLNTVRLALKVFEQYGMIEIINNTITIPNWEKHQQLDAIEHRREYQKNLMAQRRAKQKELTEQDHLLALTPANTLCSVSALDKDIDKDIDNIPPISPKGDRKVKKKTVLNEEAFETFWKEYPRKVAKAKAKESFARINPDTEQLQLMLTALEKQKHSQQWTKDNGQFIPHPTTWLNQKRWEDEGIQVENEQTEPVYDPHANDPNFVDMGWWEE